LIIINPELVSKITWEQDPDNFDVRLHRLGRYDVAEEFLVVNPVYDVAILDQIDTTVSMEACIVWANEGIWIAKKFRRSWQPHMGWHIIQCDLKVDIIVEHNPEIPNVFDYTCNIAAEDFKYEHVYYLDSQYNPFDYKIWVVKYRVADHSIVGTKDMGSIGPRIEFNPAIPPVVWTINDHIPYYDLAYDHVWHLDPRFNTLDDKVWAAKITNANSIGVKNMGYIMPRVEFNPDIPDLNYVIEQAVPYYDFDYELIWMLDNSLHTDDHAIWAAKIVPLAEPAGVKVVGTIGIKLDQFDVVFISYNEPNAEANWYLVQEKCPKAKRVRNVKGIFEAHKRAAEIAETEMFYVVDGDAELLDSFSFNFKPNIFDMDCVHLWTSRNPVNGLEYGYGGVKLFPRQLLLDATTWNVDLTTGLGKLKLVDKVSNMTAFNTDAFNTWRSAFRECAKLAASDDPAAEERLTTWCNHAVGEFKFEALCGAQAGRMHGSSSQFDLGRLKAINDYEWMKNEFNKFYGQ
jgi:hypothetical protein